MRGWYRRSICFGYRTSELSERKFVELLGVGEGVDRSGTEIFGRLDVVVFSDALNEIETPGKPNKRACACFYQDELRPVPP